MADESSLALIFVEGPCRAGKNFEWISAGLEYFSLSATSRHRRKYGSWSIAHGIRHCVFGPIPRTSGNDEGNAVEIWIDAKCNLPIQSESVNPKTALAVDVVI